MIHTIQHYHFFSWLSGQALVFYMRSLNSSRPCSIPYMLLLLLEKKHYGLTVCIHFQMTFCFKKCQDQLSVLPMAQDCIIPFLWLLLINTSLVFLNTKMPSFWQIQYVVMSQHYDKPYREDTAESESFYIPSTVSTKGMFTWPTAQSLNICSSFAVNSLNLLAEQPVTSKILLDLLLWC